MNPEAEAVLQEILKIEVDNLNEDQVKFLRARQGYLKKAQLEEYDSVINPKVKETKPPKTETVNKNAKPQTTN